MRRSSTIARPPHRICVVSQRLCVGRRLACQLMCAGNGHLLRVVAVHYCAPLHLRLGTRSSSGHRRVARVLQRRAAAPGVGQRRRLAILTIRYPLGSGGAWKRGGNFSCVILLPVQPMGPTSCLSPPARNRPASTSCRTKAPAERRGAAACSSLCPAWSAPSWLPVPPGPWGRTTPSLSRRHFS